MSTLCARIVIPIIMSCVAANSFASDCAHPVWQDEFDGNKLDLTKWTITQGDGCDQNLCGWGNNELQWYDTENISLKNGALQLRAERANNKAPRKHQAQFTSAKVTTKGKFDQRFGRFEARMKLPSTLGTWPAFWMMPANKTQTWPVEGEIDIVEQAGRTESDRQTVLGTLHFGRAWPNNEKLPFEYTNDTNWGNDFHTYAIHWAPNKISWSIDGKTYATASPEQIKPSRWPFNDQAFYMIINLAVGGTLGGEVNEDFKSATFYVDYVRVFDYCQ